ncbi:tetraspanin-1 isoform X2 [Nasonia vitripennis]|nr:tetraspanin-1 isoform X2 [Nasonia vitripennis]XP_031788934.1 tetraspanin-1 isoform X2 [Nasonia vitripennis]XP_031788935.1 tetraspanin-1 isoform X2 [Nasonia vitripennis]
MLVDQAFLITLSQDQPNFYAGLYILLAAGTLMFIISFLGCCGAYKESQCMLVSFFSCMLIVIVAQIATAAWLYANSNRLEELVKSSIQASIKYEYSIIPTRTQIVDSFQQNLGCCGATSPNDWAGSKFSSSDGSSEILLTVSQGTIFKVPKSCCKNETSFDCDMSRKIRIADILPSAIYDVGCTDQIIREFKKQSGILFGVIISLGLLEVIASVFSLILCCAIGSNDRYKA